MLQILYHKKYQKCIWCCTIPFIYLWLSALFMWKNVLSKHLHLFSHALPIHCRIEHDSESFPNLYFPVWGNFPEKFYSPGIETLAMRTPQQYHRACTHTCAHAHTCPCAYVHHPSAPRSTKRRDSFFMWHAPCRLLWNSLEHAGNTYAFWAFG